MKVHNLIGTNYVSTCTFPGSSASVIILAPGDSTLPAGTLSPGGLSDSLSGGEVVVAVVGSPLVPTVIEYYDKTYVTDFFAGFVAAFPMVALLVAIQMTRRGLAVGIRD